MTTYPTTSRPARAIFGKDAELRQVLRDWARDRGGRAVIALGVLAVGFLLWQVFGWGGDEHRTLISDVAFLPVTLIASILAFRVSRHPRLDPRTRRAWRIITVSFVFYWLGDVLWTLEENLGSAPYPSPADAAYLVFYPLLMWGVLSFPTRPRSRTDRFKLWVDTGTVVLGAFMFLWYFSLGPTAKDAGSSPLEAAVSIAYPICDLVLIFAVTRALLSRPRHGASRALGILLAGLGLFVVADVGFAYLAFDDAYAGGAWPDSLWMAAQVLMAVAAQYQHWHAGRGEPEVPASEQPPPSTTFPYVAVLVSFALLVFVGWGEELYPFGGLLLGALGVISLVITRQISTLRENVRLLQEMHAIATTDGLTGLLTRRHFFDLAHRECALARRHGRSFAAMMIDIDRFKQLNDEFGHAAGDEALALVARRCRAELRESDLICRYGGDEILVLLPEASRDHALDVAARIRAAITRDVIDTPRGPARVTLSIGVATSRDCNDLSEFLHRADMALYEAKEAGRNTTRASRELPQPIAL